MYNSKEEYNPTYRESLTLYMMAELYKNKEEVLKFLSKIFSQDENFILSIQETINPHMKDLADGIISQKFKRNFSKPNIDMFNEVEKIADAICLLYFRSENFGFDFYANLRDETNIFGSK